MAFFGVELNAQVNRLVGQIKLTLNKNKYYPNFRTIYKSFYGFDPQQNGVVDIESLDKVLQENGIFFKKFQLQAIQKAFAHEGQVNWFGFMSVLRQPMNQFRSNVIEQIFNFIDTNHQGKIHYSQLLKKFNASEFLQFKLQHKTKERIQKQLFSLVPLTSDGSITRQQFFNFYNDLSLNILDDQTFARFVSSHWKYQYKPQSQISLQQIKQGIRIVRFKLIQMTSDTHEQYILKHVFNEFDIHKRGLLGNEELYVMLVKLQMPTQKKLTEPLLKKMDKNKSGAVEYDQFKNFLFFDPYPI